MAAGDAEGDVKVRRVAIAGLGQAARQIHLPACRRIRRLEVVGGCDPRADAAADLAFPVFASAEEMLAAVEPDLLVVASPPDSHFELSRLGLEAGCHVLCEKPVVPDLGTARELGRLARAAGRQVVVNNQYRFMKIHRAAEALIGGDRFGRLLFASFDQTFRRSRSTERGWRGRELERTCKEFGTHVLDLCRFFFREEPRSIYARMPKPEDPEGPDHLVLIQLEFPGERAAHITLDRLTRGRHDYLSCRLDGTAGAIESKIGGGVGVAAGIRGGERRRPYWRLDAAAGGRARLYHGERSRRIARDPLDIFASATAGLMRAFLDAVDAGRRPPCDLEDNLRTLALMLAAYESDRRRQPIELPPGVAG